MVELCARLDSALKQRGDNGKYVLKKIAERYLPAKIVHRAKQGFLMPLGERLACELKPFVVDCLSATGLAKRGLFAPAAFERLLAQHQSSRKNHSTRLWALSCSSSGSGATSPPSRSDGAMHHPGEPVATVVPAQAGIPRASSAQGTLPWTPASAGVTDR